MKLKTVLLASALAIFTLGASAQTNTPPTFGNLPIPVSLDFLTNLPSVTNFSAMTFSLETGVATKNGTVDNFLKGDFYLHTNWMISAEIQNAPVSTVLNNASIYFGYRKVYMNAELYAQAGVRRYFSAAAEPPSWQGGLLLGASWFPMTGGKMAVTASAFFGSDPKKPFGEAPNVEVRGGLKLGF